MSEQPTGRATEIVRSLVEWMLRGARAEPGWDEMHLELRPLRDVVRVRVTEVRGRSSQARTAELPPDADAYSDARELQEISARPGLGTWISATVSARASGWPEPTIAASATLNMNEEPPTWGPGEHVLEAEDLVHLLTRHPRRAEHVPAWMAERVTAAGLSLPAVAGATAEPTAAPSVAPASPAATAPAATASGPAVGSAPASPAPASTPGPTATPGPAAPAETSTNPPLPTPRPRERRPGAILVVVDRDGIPTEDGSRPQRRRLRLGASLSLTDVLETVGTPLPFADGRGTWAVRYGTSPDDGAVLAVVEQGPGALQGGLESVHVHLVHDVPPVDLLTDDDELPLYYCSVPGPVEDVLAAARRGITTPPRPARRPPDNPVLRAAVAAYAEEPGRDRMLHVLRQALGGQIVLDATGSTLPGPDGGPSSMRLTTITTPDGSRALGAFTSNAALTTFRRKLHEKSGEGMPPEILGLAQSAPTVLELFRSNDDLTWLVVDPAGPACTLGKSEVNYALSAPSSLAVKDLLAREHTLQELFDTLREGDAHLFLAEKTQGDRPGPVFAKRQGDGAPAMVAFTSPAEVAAFGADLRSRRFPVQWLLQFFLRSGVAQVHINPSGPSAALSVAQVRHFLGNPSATPPGTASGGSEQTTP
ncbi:SseB family protein [Georgenia faecalis]|uniref:SseB family protein n=1 Tax=Georgenia faecalis TaxID=2483799 RepID=A0ABV9D750_9MICO